MFVIEVPPLSARLDDIPLLAGEFLGRFDPSGQTRLSAAALAHLGTLSYRGNVRQLKNLIERLTILHQGREIDIDAVTEQMGRRAPIEDVKPNLSLAEQMSLFEKRLIEKTLQETRGNISEAARRLQTDRANLSRKVKELDLKSNDQ